MLSLIPERAWYLRPEGLFVISAFGLWRYSWQFLHIIRMLIYKNKRFPGLRKATEQLKNKYPRRLYFVIPSYFEMPEITVNVFHAIMRECMHLPCQSIVIVISVGSEEEIRNINKIAATDYDMPNIKIIFMIQRSGKRIAMGHALRAAAREYNRLEDWEECNAEDLVVLMDGDTLLIKGILEKTLSLFKLNPNLGVVTPNNIAMSVDPQKKFQIFQSWFELKFMQRNLQFQSHSLSNRILTATGRFSVYRAPIVFSDDFIRYVEADYLDHWLYGRFRFLMGDDKSTWFYCMKEGYEMLYVPDAYIVAIEWRSSNFFKTSLSLMARWYGNTLRNNMRAIRLGPQKMGFFIWWCLIDQRLITWTPLVGIISAILLGIFSSPYQLLFYLIWVLLARLTLSWVYVLQGMHLKIEHLFLTIYSQWMGPVVKLVIMHKLNMQTWSKGKQKESIGKNPVTGLFTLIQKSVSNMLIFMNVLLLILFCGITTKTITLPTWAYLKEIRPATAHTTEKPVPHRIKIDPADFGAQPDDDLPDDAAINAAIQSVGKDSPAIIQLQSGKFILSAPIVIDKNNITLQGSGNAATLLDVRFTNDFDTEAILIKGDQGQKTGTLTNDAQKGDRLLLWTIDSAFPAPYDTPKYIWVDEAPQRNSWTPAPNKPSPWNQQAMIIPLDEANPDRAWLLHPLAMDIPTGADVYIPNLISEVTIKNLEIVQNRPDRETPPPLQVNKQNERYETMLSAHYTVIGIQFDWTVNCHIENVKTSFTEQRASAENIPDTTQLPTVRDIKTALPMQFIAPPHWPQP